jgi:hypothetical protein
MSEFKKTLQDGTPGAAAPGPTESLAPRRTRLKTTAPPTSHLYEPPPSSRDEIERRQAPVPTRIDGSATPAPRSGAALPADAPAWMVRARSMAAALEALIAKGKAITPSEEAAVERAWSSWELDGMPDKYVARVATLVDRARTAIRDTAENQLERAYNDCAQVLWASLPREIRARQDLADVLLVMRGLRDEADPWAAIIQATASILGWTNAARAHAAHALRMALDAERTS